MKTTFYLNGKKTTRKALTENPCPEAGIFIFCERFSPLMRLIGDRTF